MAAASSASSPFSRAHTHTCSHARSCTRTPAQTKHLVRFRTFSQDSGTLQSRGARCRTSAHGSLSLPISLSASASHTLPLSSRLILHHHRKHDLMKPLLPLNTGRQPAIGSYDSRWSARAANSCQEACHSLLWYPALLRSSWVHNSKCVDPP